ncbi:MAG TPA: hypothetical protein VEW46_15215 [Pyrinomonadaceae bacterium]|nr:hypothetical protein [Pyrinomonadaceae bacterium]
MESSKKEDEGQEQTAGVDSDATSKETLDDLEETEADVDSGSSKPDPGPSPDGAVDESGEIEDAGPM